MSPIEPEDAQQVLRRHDDPAGESTLVKHIADGSGIPVIDLFAGPGGLAEGFSCVRRLNGGPCFDVRLSIEKDPVAHRTLLLRSLLRSAGANVPEIYYDYLRGKATREALLAYPALRENALEASREAWNIELSLENHAKVSARVKTAVGKADIWVLIGGPPCQAYSLVGRSRMKAGGLKEFEKDARHFLYREYLRIIHDHAPPIFVMENVKGLLSAKHEGKSMFERIVEDLADAGPKYQIYPFASPTDSTVSSDFVIKAEQFGVPQARHRVFLCGVRSDLCGRPAPLTPELESTVKDALQGLPALRSRLSKEADSQSEWKSALVQAVAKVNRSGRRGATAIAELMESQVRLAERITDVGRAFTQLEKADAATLTAVRLRDWYVDPRLEGVTGHEARSHMRSDIQRYFFAASYAAVNGISPRIKDFPASLLPSHENAFPEEGDAPFQDRFRVQLQNRPSTTVVSHIAKDGHYFIHPDPAQCRSLTIREAARLQTFPDNYHFEGTRTQQFIQVGNAVPPYLAAKIAKSVFMFLSQFGRDAQSRQTSDMNELAETT